MIEQIPVERILAFYKKALSKKIVNHVKSLMLGVFWDTQIFDKNKCVFRIMFYESNGKNECGKLFIYGENGKHLSTISLSSLEEMEFMIIINDIIKEREPMFKDADAWFKNIESLL